MTDYFFQVAYTDATMRFFDKALVEKALTEASASCSFTSSIYVNLYDTYIKMAECCKK